MGLVNDASIQKWIDYKQNRQKTRNKSGDDCDR